MGKENALKEERKERRRYGVIVFSILVAWLILGFITEYFFGIAVFLVEFFSSGVLIVYCGFMVQNRIVNGTDQKQREAYNGFVLAVREYGEADDDLQDAILGEQSSDEKIRRLEKRVETCDANVHKAKKLCYESGISGFLIWLNSSK